MHRLIKPSHYRKVYHALFFSFFSSKLMRSDMPEFSRIYALQINKSNLLLATLINRGVTPDPSTLDYKHWIVFMIDEDGKDYTVEIMTQREMYRTYDVAGYSPFIMRLKR